MSQVSCCLQFSIHLCVWNPTSSSISAVYGKNRIKRLFRCQKIFEIQPCFSLYTFHKLFEDPCSQRHRTFEIFLHQNKFSFHSILFCLLGAPSSGYLTHSSRMKPTVAFLDLSDITQQGYCSNRWESSKARDRVSRKHHPQMHHL